MLYGFWRRTRSLLLYKVLISTPQCTYAFKTRHYRRGRPKSSLVLSARSSNCELATQAALTSQSRPLRPGLLARVRPLFAALSKSMLTACVVGDSVCACAFSTLESNAGRCVIRSDQPTYKAALRVFAGEFLKPANQPIPIRKADYMYAEEVPE